MAGKRTDLSDILHTILDHVYYQPPASIKMQYPCIVYSLSGERPTRADNRKYVNKKRYSVTVVDYDQDSSYPDMVGDLPYSSAEKPYTSDGLYHFPYTVYF